MLEQADELTTEPPEKRTCGDCKLCCKLLGVSSIKKPRGTWCPNCSVRSKTEGCKVHTPEEQPTECQTFECLWLQSTPDQIPDHWKPNLLKIVLAASRPVEGQLQSVVAWVDPAYPNKLRMPEVVDTLARLVTEQGIDVTAICGTRTLKIGEVKKNREIVPIDPATIN